MSQPSTVEAVLPFAAKYLGKNLPAARASCLEAINRVRSAWWKLEAMRQTVFKWTDCLCVQEFSDDCNQACQGRFFLGVTLPINVTGVDHLEWNGQHVPVTAYVSHSPRDIYGGPAYPGGIYSPQYNLMRGLSAELMTYQPPLQNEIPRNYLGTLIIKNLDTADNGKIAGIRYVTRQGTVIREDVELDTSGFETTQSPLRVMEITFPKRCGYIQVLTEDGFVLGAYHPSVLCPKHRRIRLTGFLGCCQGATIECEGLMEPLDVVYDTDRVELASGVDWQNGLMALDLHFKSGKTESEFQTLSQATQFATGSADAELRAQQDTPVANLRPRGVTHSLRKINFLERRRGIFGWIR